MEIIYCKKWWFPRKKPIEIFNEETARNNHLSGENGKERRVCSFYE